MSGVTQADERRKRQSSPGGIAGKDQSGWRDAFLKHTWRKADHWWPGWDATLNELPPDVLISEAKSKTYEGLWLREPGQFLHDAMPRAQAYLEHFPAPPPAFTPAR